MKKIPTLFLRDRTTGFVTQEIDPVNQWINEKVSTPYQKWDGTCVMMDENNQWWSRREIKENQNSPTDFIQEDFDPLTGSSFGWVPIFSSSYYKYFLEAYQRPSYEYILNPELSSIYLPGTYELMGPRINKNPENLNHHVLMRHAASPVVGNLTIFKPEQIQYDVVRSVILNLPIEGVVWYSVDGERAKIKRRDFADARKGIGSAFQNVPMQYRDSFYW